MSRITDKVVIYKVCFALKRINWWQEQYWTIPSHMG